MYKWLAFRFSSLPSLSSLPSSFSLFSFPSPFSLFSFPSPFSLFSFPSSFSLFSFPSPFSLFSFPSPFSLFFLFFLSSLVSWNGHGAEVEASFFMVCDQKRATGLQIRTLKIHKSLDEDKYLAIYSQQGKDQLLFKGRWLNFAQKAISKQKDRLQRSGWQCDQVNSSSIFYSQF